MHNSAAPSSSRPGWASNGKHPDRDAMLPALDESLIDITFAVGKDIIVPEAGLESL